MNSETENIFIMIPGLLANFESNITDLLQKENIKLYEFWYKNPLSNKSFTAYLHLVLCTCNEIFSNNPNKSFIIYGHSLGGAIITSKYFSEIIKNPRVKEINLLSPGIYSYVPSSIGIFAITLKNDLASKLILMLFRIISLLPIIFTKFILVLPIFTLPISRKNYPLPKLSDFYITIKANDMYTYEKFLNGISNEYLNKDFFTDLNARRFKCYLAKNDFLANSEMIEKNWLETNNKKAIWVCGDHESTLEVFFLIRGQT
jgi:hypothetical protein